MSAGSQPSKEGTREGLKRPRITVTATRSRRNRECRSRPASPDFEKCRRPFSQQNIFAFYHGPKWYACVSTHSNHGQIALQKKRNTFDEAEMNNLPTKARDQDIKAWRRTRMVCGGRLFVKAGTSIDRNLICNVNQSLHPRLHLFTLLFIGERCARDPAQGEAV